jgi:hypothetical protein
MPRARRPLRKVTDAKARLAPTVTDVSRIDRGSPSPRGATPTTTSTAKRAAMTTASIELRPSCAQ